MHPFVVAPIHYSVSSRVIIQIFHSSSFFFFPTDKATSTDDISPRFPYSMDVADALSQLSYTSEVFEEMLKRSADNDRVSRETSASSQEVVHFCFFSFSDKISFVWF